MNKVPCLYAIVRFAPFVETGEFANVGVAIIAPAQRYFGFKLMGKRIARVAGFFEQLDAKIFRRTMAEMGGELARVQQLLKQNWFGGPQGGHDMEFAQRLFMEVVRCRETVIKFSEVRGVLAENPESKLDELYGYYVERDFVTKEYQEAVLERGMRKWLDEAGVAARFVRQKVGDEVCHASFPFVEQEGGIFLKAIKPLHLAQDQPGKILDHGGRWLFRTQTLKRRNLLPRQVLFAVAGPDGGGARAQAYEEVVASLRKTGVDVLDYLNGARILEYLRPDAARGQAMQKHAG